MAGVIVDWEGQSEREKVESLADKMITIQRVKKGDPDIFQKAKKELKKIATAATEAIEGNPRDKHKK